MVNGRFVGLAVALSLSLFCLATSHAHHPVAKPLHLVHDEGTPVPYGFDCKARHLALEFAMKLQPFRGASDFKAVAEELNAPGGSPGGPGEHCSNVTYNGPATEFRPHFPTPSDALFVDATKGSDSNPGTIDKPFLTVQHAVDVAGERKAATTIALRAGTHYLASRVNITEQHHGLTVQNYNGEEAWLSGGVVLKGQWKPHATLKNVYAMDLSGQPLHNGELTGLRRNRQRAFRARYPNGCKDPTTPSGYACQGSTGNPLEGFGSSQLTDWVFPPSPTMNTPDEFHPSSPVRSSGASFQTYQLGVGGGQCEAFSPPAGYWCGNACDGGAPKPPDCIARWPLGLKFNSTVLPNAPYKDASMAVVQAWHPGHWASWMFGISSANDTHLMFSNPGFQGARGAYPDKMADAFFVENVLEELDFENEFFYDQATHTLLFYTEKGQPAASEVWEATQLKEMVHVMGTNAPVLDVTFRGLGFRDAALTYLDEHAMPSGGDWGLGRLAAFFVRNAERTTIDSCNFDQLDGNAILVNAFARDTLIQNNRFHEIGDNIIALLGETKGAPAKAWGMGPDGTDGNQPRFTTVQSNFAYQCGLFEKQSSFYFQAKSCQNTIRDNIFFHGPRAGINFNDGFGGASTLESNLLFSTVMESGDHGPFNSWDRQPYITRVRDGITPSVEKAFDVIRGNFFIGNYYGQEAIDNDDGSAYYETHHNVFVYADTGMKNDFNGHDNHHHDNLYAFISRGVGICPALAGHADRFYNNKVIQLSNGGYASYDCNCEGDVINGTCPFFENNMIFTPDGTMGDICGKTLEQWQQEGRDLGSEVLPWPEDDQAISWARETLDLPELRRGDARPLRTALQPE